MDKLSRREALRDFKERKTVRGVGGARNLAQQQNSIWFGLKNGGYINRAAQAAWTAHGEGAFAFEVLETFDDEEMTPVGRADLMKARTAHWRTELGAPKLVG